MSVAVTSPAHRAPYRGYRFPPEIIAHAVWLDFRFHLSFRDVQDLLAERGVIVSHESIRQVVRQVRCGLPDRAASTTHTGWRQMAPG